MELASILLNIGGDNGTQVPKYNVTPSEVRVLQLLHGEDAVSDITITGEVDRSSRKERGRLRDVYARTQADGTKVSPEIDTLFPGEAARLYDTFDEAFDVDGEHEHMFRAREEQPVRNARKAGTEEIDVQPNTQKYADKTVAQIRALAEERGINLAGADRKAEIIAKLEEADQQAAIEEDAENDGIEDMPRPADDLFSVKV